MSEPIKAGDLVMIVKDFCGCDIGEIFVAGEIQNRFNSLQVCNECGTYGDTPILRTRRLKGWYPVSWLKRIPPLSELDDVRQDEEIHA
jgi:hypothetical protein